MRRLWLRALGEEVPMSLDVLKKALPGMFFKDLSRFEPDKTGVAIGDNIRIHEDAEKGFVLRFLRDTAYGSRKQVTDRLDQAKLPYVLGDDFTF
jgi:hypothetical protein